MRVYSEPNSGTTFKIYLRAPTRKPDSNGGRGPKQLPSCNGIDPRREDEPGRKLAVIIILRENAVTRCRNLNNAFEALELIRRNAPFLTWSHRRD